MNKERRKRINEVQLENHSCKSRLKKSLVLSDESVKRLFEVIARIISERENVLVTVVKVTSKEQSFEEVKKD